MFGKKKKEQVHNQDLNSIRYTDFGSTTTAKKSKKLKNRKSHIIVDKPRTSNEVVKCIFDDFDPKSTLFKTKDDTYSICFKFDDIAFAKLDTAEATNIFCKWRDILNAMPENVHVQFVNSNKKELTKSFKQRFCIPKTGYGNQVTERVRQEFNNKIQSVIGEGKSTLITTKYIVLSIKAASFQEAEKELANAVGILNRGFEGLGTKLEVVGCEERLEFIYDVINPGLFKVDYNGRKFSQLVSNLADSTGNIVSVQDIMAPNYWNMREFKLMETHNNIEAGSRQKFMSSLYVSKYPTEISPVFFNRLTTLENVSAIVSCNIQSSEQGRAVKMIQNKVVDMKSERLEKVKRSQSNGYSYDMVQDLNLESSIEAAEQLLTDIRSNGQKIFEMNILITVLADTYDELRDSVKAITALGSESLVAIKPVMCMQLEGLANTLPTGSNSIHFQRTMTSEAVSCNVPFNSEELQDESGLFLGENLISKQPIFFDQLKLINQNSCILATSGSGKSFLTKLLIEQIYLKKSDNIIIIDPQREYKSLVEAFNGAYVKISNSSNTIINPFDLGVNYSLADNATDPISEKSEFIISFIESLIMKELSGVEKSIIDRTVRSAYEFYKQSGYQDQRLLPNLAGFYTILESQPEAEAKTLAKALERFAKTRNIFNGYSNVDLRNKLVCFDIKDLPESLQATGYLVIIDFITNKMSQNKVQNIRSNLFIDECHILLGSPYASSYLVKLWKIARKYALSCYAITQNLSDIVASTETAKILSNSESAILLKNKEQDIPILQEYFGVSDSMAQYITDPKPGEGLIVAGKKVLPYSLRFDRNTTIYALNNTSS